ncbi:MAG: SHOCT domain-containing protein [Candidatus Liptonbacteria bacterium]|nr:SHOCT domain-containing protein [Candidatus Liptonbacteria bacterium]
MPAFAIGGAVFAHGMSATTGIEEMSNVAMVSDGHTAIEEAEGKAVWEKLQNKELACKDLSDDNFGALGEYFMGRMTGTSHEAVNNMMIQMLGEQGEEQMHAVMGKRLSDCDASAAFPPQGVGFMPMMQMITGGLPAGQAGWSSPVGSSQLNNSMMNFGFTPLGGFGWIFMIFWWVLIIAGVVALIKWLGGQSRGSHGHDKSPVEILKERYAKGEIDRKEFEEKKREVQ